MAGSHYVPLGPFDYSQTTPNPEAQQPSYFSSTIRNPAYDPIPYLHSPDDGTYSTQNQPLRYQQWEMSGGQPGDTSYRGFDGNGPGLRPAAGRNASSRSSIWSANKGFSVSHFNVPAAASPWEHELSEKHGAALPPSSTVRYFDRRRQRARLLFNSSFQWTITALICAAMAGSMYGFSKLIGMSSTIKHIFNALITGFSLCLGLNLSSSLTGYAQMMRWRFLASGYRTLQDFELVMNCDSQSHTLRLLWAGRTRGKWYPNKTQLVALLWLLVNLGLQVSTALVGLTYSINVSSEYVRLTYGNVSISDVTYIGNQETVALYRDDPESAPSVLAQTAVANQWGVTGQDYSVVNTTFDDDNGKQQVVYINADESMYWYRFIDRSPLAFSQSTATSRTVNVTASCESFEVTYGGYGGFQSNDSDLMWGVVWVDNQGNSNSWWIEDVATGATTWMGNMSSDCGERCAQIYALQTADNMTNDVPEPRFWSCLVNVSPVDNVHEYINPSQYQIPDLQATILAGSIGWSGVVTRGDSPMANLQVVRYPADSQSSPPGNISSDDMARLVMKFTTGAISALDTDGPRLNVTGYGPAPAQILQVQWKYAAAVLGGIPTAQAVVLLAVVLFANKAIIKDTSHLSMARLLRPIVDKLGDTGCLLTGDEIAERLGNYRVIYGVRGPGRHGVPPVGVGDDGTTRHVDIIDEAEGLGYRRGGMPEGRYDGLHPAPFGDEQARLLVREQEPSAEVDRPQGQDRWSHPDRKGRRMSV
ncbi:hypothetical protein KCU88_g7227, partial [Aureobasidium melanogenum]